MTLPSQSRPKISTTASPSDSPQDYLFVLILRAGFGASLVVVKLFPLLAVGMFLVLCVFAGTLGCSVGAFGGAFVYAFEVQSGCV